MALNRYVDVIVNNSDGTAKTKENLIVFAGDKNVDIYFRLIDYRYQFKLNASTEEDWNLVYNLTGADAWVTIVNPNGEETEQGKNSDNVILQKEYVKFTLTSDLTDELDEVGIYKLQIHITDGNNAEATIPEFTFEVKERLSGGGEAVNALMTESGSAIQTESMQTLVASGTGTKISSLVEKNSCAGTEYVAVVDGNTTKKMKTSLLKGKDGINGQNGATPTIQVGTITTLAAGSNATVTASTDNNVVTLNFGIPKGTDGVNESSGLGENSSWSPYYVPHEGKATADTDKVNSNWTTAQMYDAYDRLMAAYPTYIKRHICEYKDTSNTYELRRYILEPEGGYDKTIYVQTGTHGYEYAGQLALLRICQIICEEWQTNQSLSYIRNRVRMVVIPLTNPWGHDNGGLLNVNEVNCNRNFDGMWASVHGASYESGEYPFSENETKWIRDTVEWIGVENIHYAFDFHDAGSTSVHGDFWINYNTFLEKSGRNVIQLVKYLSDKKQIENPNIYHVCDTNTYGVFASWMNKTLGVPSSTVEHCYDVKDFSAEFMNNAVDVYFNTLISHTLEDYPRQVGFNSDNQYFGMDWFEACAEKELDNAPNGFKKFSDIVALWDSLVNKYNGYLSKSEFSVTTADNLEVNYYIASPKMYNKTIVIVGGTMLANTNYKRFPSAMYKFMKLLAQSGNKDPYLAYIRNNVRVIFIPYINYTTTVNANYYLNIIGNFNTNGTPNTSNTVVNNLVNILNDIGNIDGVVYSTEKTQSQLIADVTEVYSTSPTQTYKPYNYVDYLTKEKNVIAEIQSTNGELADYVWLVKNKPCIRIDTGIDINVYEKHKSDFSSSDAKETLNYDDYAILNYETKHRVENMVNVIYDMCNFVSGEVKTEIPVTGVEIADTLSIQTGKSSTISSIVSPATATNKNILWSSSNPDIAIVDSTGLVYGISEGNIIVTARTIDGNFTDICNVSVSEGETQIINVTGVTLNKNNSSLTIGNSEQLTYTISPLSATNKTVNWSTSDISKATVNNGLVNAVGEGSVTITVTTVDGYKTNSCVYTITSSSTEGGGESPEPPEPPDIDNFVNYAYNTDTFTNPANGLAPFAPTYYVKYNVDKSVDNGVCTLVKTGNPNEDTYFIGRICMNDGKKYYVQCKLKTTYSGWSCGNNIGSKDNINTNDEWQTVSYILTDTDNNLIFSINGKNAEKGSTIQLKEIMKINLTELYGAGNEPTKEVCDGTFTTYKTGLVG